MMPFLTVLLVILGVFGWCALVLVATVNFLDGGSPRVGLIAVIAAVLSLAAALTWGTGKSGPLCARGHETYQQAGKTLQRVWVCDEVR